MNPFLIEQLGLSLHTLRSLRQAGISTVEQLSAKTERELKSISSLGTKSFTEIQSALGRPAEKAAYKKQSVQELLEYEKKRSELLQEHCAYLGAVLCKHGLEHELVTRSRFSK